MYYNNNKDKLLEYGKDYRTKKQTELKYMMANNEYDKLKSNNTEIIPHYDDIKSEHKLRLRYYLNGYKFEKKKGYKT